MSFVQSIDLQILVWLASHRAPALTALMLFFTIIGGTLVVIILTSTATAVLVHQRRIRDAAGLLLSVIAADATAQIIKFSVARARPDMIFQSYTEFGYSFPSMHAAAAAGLYGYIAWLICRDYSGRASHIAILCLTGICIFGIGLSRVYLGVHYPSDVLAGYAVGALCVWLGIRISSVRNH